MGEVDTERQALNVARMRLLGAEVIPVKTGSRTLKDAINDAYRDWVASVENDELHLRHRGGPAPVPRDGARLPEGHQRRGARAAARRGRPAPRRRHRVRRRRLQRDRHVRRLPRRRGRQALRRRGGRRRRRHAPPRGIHRARTTRRAPRREDLRAAGRGRPDDRVALDLGGPRLPGRRARALVARVDRARRVHPRDRRRGDAGAAPAVRDRGHHPRDRVRARPRRRAADRARARPRRDPRGLPLRPRRQGHGHRRALLRALRRRGAARPRRDAATPRGGQGRGTEL